MKTGIRIVGLLVWSGLAFGGGYLFREHRLLHGGRFVTTKALILRTLYSYGGPDEQPQFVLFVGTQALNTLSPQPSRHWLEVSPDVAADSGVEP